MKKKIVLILLGQPSTNPISVKEATLLSEAGFEVHVLYMFTSNWALNSDEILLKNVKWNYKLVGGTTKFNKGIYIITKLKQKVFKILDCLGTNRFTFAERAAARGFDELVSEAKKLKADWYIGHNLGALSIAVIAAKYHKAKAGFDFEDYHRGEYQLHEKKEISRITFLENKYVPSLNYYSTASDLITEVTKKNHPGFSGPIITLLNCFPLTQQPTFINKQYTDTTLQLFWFSQTIGTNRGLENLVEALKILDDTSIHLTLAGSCTEEMKKYLETITGKLFENIHFAGIVEPDELPNFAAKFDVGLALELPVPLNRDICLTNKILTYLLAGNAVILSNTSMQIIFNNKYNIGEVFLFNDSNSLSQKIKYYKDLKKLNTQRLYNYDLASSQLNWENESRKLLQIIK